MPKITWDDPGMRFYETGVDHGVLYIPDDATGEYSTGVAWNGLTTVTESPSGGDSTPQYADNIKYLNLISAEQLSVTVEAFTYPDEFAQFDGLASLVEGVQVAQQPRPIFGLSYRSRLGNDLQGDSYGYKLHLLYGCTAAPSEKAYATVNDSPAAIAFSWSVATNPVAVTDHRPTSLLIVDASKIVDPVNLTALEDVLYGGAAAEARLPLPDEVVTILGGGVVVNGASSAARRETETA
jgi:hypothetical protein